jgi:hypothetical protein
MAGTIGPTQVSGRHRMLVIAVQRTIAVMQ